VNNYSSECINMQDDKNAVRENSVHENDAIGYHTAPVIDITTALKRSLAKNGLDIPRAAMAKIPHLSRKPHTNTRRGAGTRSRGIHEGAGGNGSLERQHAATGDPLPSDGVRVSAPHGQTKRSVGTPKCP
jgi:hypothetical protein